MCGIFNAKIGQNLNLHSPPLVILGPRLPHACTSPGGELENEGRLGCVHCCMLFEKYHTPT